MRTVQLGGLRCRIVGEDGPDDVPTPVVVLCHGYGAPGDDLVPLARALPLVQPVRWVFPEAPLSLGASLFGDSRAWWPIDVERLERAIATGSMRDMSAEVPEGLAEARSALQRALSALPDALGGPVGPLVLGGFSQGAMLATDTALRGDADLAGLALLSGTLLAETEWRPLMARRAGLPVLQSHGTQDPLLPFAIAERLRDALAESGLDVEFVGFHGGHEIPPAVLSHLASFLARLFRD